MCNCPACSAYRAAKAQPRTVRHFDRVVPAWHVPLTPEWTRYDAALRAMRYAHPHESLMEVVLPRAWERLVTP